MEVEKTLSKDQLIALLEQLTQALKGNSDSPLQLDGHTVTLSTDLSCEFEYEEEDDQCELEIELKWQATPQAESSKKNGGGKFEVFQGKDDKWYFHLKAANNQIILASEGYESKQGAHKGIASVKENASFEHFETRTSKSRQPYFVLKAKNGEIIGVSQMYKRRVGSEKGIASVIHHSKAEIAQID